jgi:gliding motility-associated-like protein
LQSPVASPSSSTQYIITVNPGQCSAKDTVNVTVEPIPQLQVSNDTTLCNGASVQIIATSPGNVTYTWSPVTGLNNSSINNPVASPSSTTTYFVLASGGNGCHSTDSVTINVLAQPTVATIGDTAICSGVSIQLTTSVTNGNTYSWSPSTGLSNPALQNPVANPSANTRYIITVNPGTQCTATDSVNIAVNPLPVVQATGDTTLCAGGSGQISAVSPNNVSYNWSPVAGLSNPAIYNPVASPTSSTIYTVLVTDGNNCSSAASVTVNVNPQPVFAISPAAKQICVGDPLTITASGGDIYQWFPPETVASPTAASTQVNPQSSTTYGVAITNSTCKITDTVYSVITVSGQLNVTVSKSNDVDCLMGSTNLLATGGYNYTWTPAATLNFANIANPVASPLETTVYYVTVKKNGCTAQDSITVNVNAANAEYAYKVASAFTPNGDNVNDCFGLKYWGGVKTLEFEIYNRWGNRVFYTTDVSKCWDGTFNGTPQPTGTFVYQIKATTICGNIYRKGTLVLIR